MYDYIIVTHIPAFYKINLYNELSKKIKILVVFIASNTNEKRSDDFIHLDESEFEYKLLHTGNIQDRDIQSNVNKLRSILKNYRYKKIIIGGWSLFEFWYIAYTTSRTKNCLILESTINESSTNSLKGLMKKIFLKRVSKVFASGKLHKKLLDHLKYGGDVSITRGVGIINKPKYSLPKKTYSKKYLFVGRLSSEKNLEMLINVFNKMSDCRLTIVGTGPLEQALKNKAGQNILFEGQVDNQKLDKYFYNNDILILSSTSETWGLVVEEALYFGLPVIVSRNCGVCELIKEGVNGYIIDLKNTQGIENRILSINNEVYCKLVDGVKKLSVDQKDLEQIRVYFAS